MKVDSATLTFRLHKDAPMGDEEDWAEVICPCPPGIGPFREQGIPLEIAADGSASVVVPPAVSLETVVFPPKPGPDDSL